MLNYDEQMAHKDESNACKDGENCGDTQVAVIVPVAVALALLGVGSCFWIAFFVLRKR